MVVSLRLLAAEVTRVTLEVGSEGKLGGQAVVPGVEGVWELLVNNVCSLSSSFSSLRDVYFRLPPRSPYTL
jgi:osomolarity two-component system, sensor histidine kinase NIK1